MKKIVLLLGVMVCIAGANAQFIYKIKADSVLITNDSCTAELNLENSTKAIKGFLYNKGNGRTDFRKVEKLNDSTLVIGEDTLVVRGAGIVNASNGLSVVNDTVKLGGTLVEETFVNVSNNGLYIGSVSNGKINLHSGSFGVSNSTFEIEEGKINYFVQDVSDGTKGILADLQFPGLIVGDVVDFLGMVYGNDYSGNGLSNDRWIPDIAAVRQTISDSLTAQPTLASGTFTPTATNGTNVSASTPNWRKYAAGRCE